jgi:hypothetical protein
MLRTTHNGGLPIILVIVEYPRAHTRLVSDRKNPNILEAVFVPGSMNNTHQDKNNISGRGEICFLDPSIRFKNLSSGISCSTLQRMESNRGDSVECLAALIWSTNSPSESNHTSARVLKM